MKWIVVICLILLTTSALASNNYTERFERVVQSIQMLSSINQNRVERIAFEVIEASDESGLDPLIVVSIINRESGFRRDVEELRVFGQLGERGLMQVHGVALGYRPADCTARLEGVRCQIRTGVRFLAAVRDACGGSTDRWVASYGMSRCASERAARRHHTVRQARNFYRQIGGNRW